MDSKTPFALSTIHCLLHCFPKDVLQRTNPERKAFERYVLWSNLFGTLHLSFRKFKHLWSRYRLQKSVVNKPASLLNPGSPKDLTFMPFAVVGVSSPGSWRWGRSGHALGHVLAIVQDSASILQPFAQPPASPPLYFFCSFLHWALTTCSPHSSYELQVTDEICEAKSLA